MEPDATSPTDVTISAGLTIEGFAEVLAHTQHFARSSLLEVLLRLGLDEDQWETASRAWAAALADESSVGRTVLAARFGTAFGATLALLGAAQPSLASLGPLPTEGNAVPTSANLDDTPVVTRTVEVPTYLRDSVRPEPREPDRIDPDLVPPSLRGITDPCGTVPVDPVAASRPVLPFDASATPATSPEPRGKAERYLMGVLLGGETQDVSTVVASMVARGEVYDLPWSSSPEPKTAPEEPAGHASNPERSAPDAKPPSEDAANPITPLDTRPTALDAAHSLPISTTTRTEPPPSLAMPPPVPALTVEQYASLCVEVGLWPAESESILRRYGLTVEHRSRLDNVWKSRMQADAALRDMWRRAFDTYSDWVLGQPRSAPRRPRT
jgi:hypothetical protein